MADTTYTNFQPPAVDAEWLNDVNRLQYQILNNPQDAADVTATLTVADASNSGVMSASDKVKLDGIETAATADQSAIEVPYDNSSSGLVATNVKTAIDEVSAATERTFTTVAVMKAADLTSDTLVSTQGYLSVGDGRASDYAVIPVGSYAGTPNGIEDHLADSGLFVLVRNISDGATTATYTVGTGGDYLTLNEALTAVSTYRLKQVTPQFNVTLNLLTGFTLSEQILCDNVDLGWVTITSVDATVTIIGSSMDTDSLLFDGIVHKYAFGATNGGVLPVIGTLFVVDGSSISAASAAVALNKGSRGTVLLGKGVQSAPKNGITLENSFLFSRGADFSNAGAYGAYLYAGGELNGDSLDVAGATDDGIIVTRTARVEVHGINVSGAGVNGLLATQGATVNAGEINADNCSSGAGVRARGAAVVSANSISAQNCSDGVYADRGSNFSIDDDTVSSNFTGCSRYAIFSRKGSRVSGNNVVCGGARVFAELGGVVNIPNVTVANVTNGAHALSTETGGEINADGGTISTTATASRAIKATGGRISATSATITGTQGLVIDSRDGAEIKTSKSTINVTVGGALFCNGGDINATSCTFNAVDQLIFDSLTGGKMDCGSATINWSGTPPATAFRVKDGVIMNVSGTTEGANITVNTITSDGIVIQ